MIDAAGLRFIDAAGLGALMRLRGTLASQGVSLRTIHPSDHLRRMSSLCQLDATLGLQPAELPPPPRRSPAGPRTHRDPQIPQPSAASE